MSVFDGNHSRRVRSVSDSSRVAGNVRQPVYPGQSENPRLAGRGSSNEQIQLRPELPLVWTRKGGEPWLVTV